MQIKIRGNRLTCQVVIKFWNLRRLVEVLDRNNDAPLPSSSTVLLIVSVRETQIMIEKKPVINL